MSDQHPSSLHTGTRRGEDDFAPQLHMEGRFVCWRSLLQMIDDVLDIDMMRSCHSRKAGREIPTAE